MSVNTYWLVATLIGIGLSGFGWLALWLTRARTPREPITKKVFTG